MANNQNVNKVVYAGTTLIDLTGDDVTAGDVLSGKKFHLPSGAQAIGTMSGGGGEVYAAISVTYPAGSVCTATNGTITLTAADTSGQVVFGIPEPSSTPETWTVSCTDGTDTDSTTVDISAYGQMEKILLSYIPDIVNNATWEQISQVSIAGLGDTFWDIGDGKSVLLSVTNLDSQITLNTTLYVFILDFNHPINKNIADNNIIWGGFKTALTNGVDVAITNGGNLFNETSSSGRYINMNHTGGGSSSPFNTNYGGWKGCDLRYDVLGATSTAPSGYGSKPTTSRVGYDATIDTISNPKSSTLLAAFPSELRAALRLWDRYIDFKGNKSNTDANCSTVTIDAISLLTEYEVFGLRIYANMYEQTHQKQMRYYENGNSKKKYCYDYTTRETGWLLASPHYNIAGTFCSVSTYGSVTYVESSRHHGLAPAFRT